jgi:hypothetical protein
MTGLARFFIGFVGWASTAQALLPAVLHEDVEIDDCLKQILQEMAHLSYSPQTEFIPGQKLWYSSDILPRILLFGEMRFQHSSPILSRGSSILFCPSFLN